MEKGFSEKPKILHSRFRPWFYISKRRVLAKYWIHEREKNFCSQNWEKFSSAKVFWLTARYFFVWPGSSLPLPPGLQLVAYPCGWQLTASASGLTARCLSLTVYCSLNLPRDWQLTASASGLAARCLFLGSDSSLPLPPGLQLAAYSSRFTARCLFLAVYCSLLLPWDWLLTASASGLAARCLSLRLTARCLYPSGLTALSLGADSSLPQGWQLAASPFAPDSLLPPPQGWHLAASPSGLIWETSLFLLIYLRGRKSALVSNSTHLLRVRSLLTQQFSAELTNSTVLGGAY